MGAILERVTANTARLDRTGRRASVATAGGAGQLAAVLRCLDEASIRVDEIGVRRPTLDEVFPKLTGNHADAAPSTDNDHEGNSR